MRKLTAAFLIILCIASSACAAVHRNVALLVAGGTNDTQAPEFVNSCSEGLKMAKHNYVRTLSTKLFDIKNYKSKNELLTEAAKWADLIIVPVPEFRNELPQFVKDYPKVEFVTFDPVPNAKLVHFRDEETGFLAGALAAVYARSAKDPRIKPNSRIGAVFGPDNDAIARMKYGFKAGVWYVDKTLDPLIVHTEDFVNRSAVADLAHRMHERNVNVIFTAAGNAGLGASDIAEKENFWTIGVDNEVEKQYPKAVLASAVKRVDYVVYAVIDRYMQKQIAPKDVSVGIKEGAIGLSTWTREAKTNVPLSIRKRVEEIEDKLEAGLIVLPDYKKQQ